MFQYDKIENFSQVVESLKNPWGINRDIGVVMGVGQIRTLDRHLSHVHVRS